MLTSADQWADLVLSVFTVIGVGGFAYIFILGVKYLFGHGEGQPRPNRKLTEAELKARLLKRVLAVAFVLWTTGAQATPLDETGLFVDLGLGATFFQPTVPDGLWYQQAFPHSFKTVDFAGRAGLGYRVNDHWSATASYLRMGIVGSTSQFVFDGDYDPVAHRCLNHCSTPFFLRARDRVQGGEVSVKYQFVTSSILQSVLPFLRVGSAWMYHHVVATAHDQGNNDISADFKGWMPMAVLGGGLCYQGTWPTRICAEASYYYGVGTASQGFPISTRMIVPLLTVQVPLW